jgi:hypothetical protein
MARAMRRKAKLSTNAGNSRDPYIYHLNGLIPDDFRMNANDAHDQAAEPRQPYPR